MGEEIGDIGGWKAGYKYLMLDCFERFPNDRKKINAKEISPTNLQRSKQRDQPIIISNDCRKINAKEITLTNLDGSKQCYEPIRIRSNY